MNPTTLNYAIFFGLLLVALIAWVGSTFSKKRREQARAAALFDAQPELDPVTDTTPVTVATPTPAPSSGLSSNPYSIDPAAAAFGMSAASNLPSYAAQPATANPAGAAAMMTGSESASWVPPEPKTWQPGGDEIYKVTWGSHELFGETLSAFDQPNNIPKVTPDQVPTADKSDYAFGTATPLMAAMMPATAVETVAKELKQAGYYQPHAMQNLQATRFALACLGLVIAGGVMLLVPARLEVFAAIGLFALPALLWALPRVQIQSRAAGRRSELERGMPDMLDMLNMCVSQGLTIPTSLKRIARDLKPVYPVLAGELQIVVHQAEVGTLNVALDNFADRSEVPEVDSFTTLMNQSERMGTNVSDALTEYSNTMRESLRQRTDEKANKAQLSLMFPTVLFMMPAVFLFLMGPMILELQTVFDGGGMQNIGTTDALRTLGNQPIPQ